MRTLGTRKKILGTALRMFRLQGYDATSLRQIAEHLEITKAAVYYHFPAKEQILFELSQPFLDDVERLINLARSGRVDPDGEDEQTWRRTLLHGWLGSLVVHHEVVNLLAMDAATQRYPEVGQRARQLMDELSAELSGPDADAETRVRVACALAAISAIAGLDSEQIEQAVPTVFAAAVAALESEPASHPG